MQMEDASKVQFGRLNDEGFYFSNGIMSLPYGHPSLENLRKEKYDFLKQKSKAIDNNPRLHVLKQIFNQSLMFYILDSTIISITKGWKSTKEQILSGNWK